MTLDEIRQYHKREEKISEARMCIFRLVNRKPRVYQRITRKLRSKNIDLAAISAASLEKQVRACRASCL